MFPKIEKYSIRDFYQLHYKPVEGLWDHRQLNDLFQNLGERFALAQTEYRDPARKNMIVPFYG